MTATTPTPTHIALLEELCNSIYCRVVYPMDDSAVVRVVAAHNAILDALLQSAPAAPVPSVSDGLPSVPSSVISLITAYGDARADGLFAGGAGALAAVITELRPLLTAQQPTPVASPEQEREAFEVWFSQDREFPRAVERSGSSYKFMPAHVAWGVWQARAALAATASLWVSVDDRLPAGPAAQGAQP